MAMRHIRLSISRRFQTKPSSVCLHCGTSHSVKLQMQRIKPRYLLSDELSKNLHRQPFSQIVRNFTVSASVKQKKSDPGNSNCDDEIEELLSEESSRSEEGSEYLLPGDGHRVFLIQPDLRHVNHRSEPVRTQLQLEESCALVHSLPKWGVIGQSIERVRSLKSVEVFGKGTTQAICQKVQSSDQCTAVYINLGMLTGAQLSHLQKVCRKPIYDRFTMVLQIFKIRAQTKEAKLQVALAEVPFYRSRLTGIHLGTLDQQKGGVSYIGGAGETMLELRHRLLKDKEVKIKRALNRVKENRELLRRDRKRRECPTVAVVGYTNAGKTSLIKMLTQDEKMMPRHQLFATLDVTAHPGLLPNRLKVLYIDTVGFISDIPANLIASFAATLEDAIYADVILHVRDISHPDTEMQKQTVIQTLEGLRGDGNLLDKVIEVCNKVDKVDRKLYRELIPEGAVGISSTIGYGVDELQKKIEDLTVEATGRVRKCLKVPMNGPHLVWLYKEATVEETQSCDSDSESLLVLAVMRKATYAKFVSTFGSKQKKTMSSKQT